MCALRTQFPLSWFSLNTGVTVNYKDVESIDPEYAKNLQVHTVHLICMLVGSRMCIQVIESF